MPMAMTRAPIPKATSSPLPYPILKPITNPKAARKPMTTSANAKDLRRLADSSE